MNFIFSFLLASVMWVQVPQWEADLSKCAVDVSDSSCHWYVAAPDNTFGDGLGRTFPSLMLMDCRILQILRNNL
tara:strand:+ start:56 stop:277 length:222 start_codon:yes stop_codon:yes gene_type:complete